MWTFLLVFWGVFILVLVALAIPDFWIMFLICAPLAIALYLRFDWIESKFNK